MLPVRASRSFSMWWKSWCATASSRFCSSPGRNKTSIENHFDHDPELFRTLTAANKKDLLHELGFEELQTHFFYTRQRLQKGLGDAILCGENFAGEDPFLVALGDSILGLHANSTVVTRLAKVFESKRASCVIAVEEVPARGDQPLRIVQPEPGGGDAFRVIDLIEKPRAGESAEQSGHRRALCFFAADLRHDPPHQAGPSAARSR